MWCSDPPVRFALNVELGNERDPAANPTFYDWISAYVPSSYCNGTSFSGRRQESLVLDGPRGPREEFLRGGFVRDAVAAMLLPLGLANASALVVSGTSAGGLAALMHVDWFPLPAPPNPQCPHPRAHSRPT